MNVGDLVMIRQDVPEYVAERGTSLGVIIGAHDPKTVPQLFEVLWTGGEVESLYEDELDSASR